ncbi:ATP-binding protein [Paeniglutamicibacter psychrophenolicus]|uniref:ATPase n=1 Tax=Paeniglutamicibacter psychrophenolicus TaxID=257454 RepID=A0ABS4WE82_9MICC|nr:putative ATPase [Paeniglutamicibacter psychrophenolicus]
MFLTFRVKNFRSIRDVVELDFRRTKPLEFDDRSVDDKWDSSINTVTAIYGANASGKTSVLEALGFFLGFIEASQEGKPGASIDRDPFLLDDHSRMDPTEYELEFVMGGVRHQYGFQVSDSAVESEWLFVYNSAKPTVYFDRDSSQAEPYQFGRALKGQNQIISTLTRSNALFLSCAAQNAHVMLTEIYKYLVDAVSIYTSSGYEAAHKELTARLHENTQLRERVLAVLRASDTGISGISIDVREMNVEERSRIVESILSSGAAATADEADGFIDRFLEDEKYQIHFQHQGADGNYPLKLSAESTGTRALLSHADAVFRAIDRGGVCVFDEIDTSLHPMLVSELVRIFQSPETNPLQAQLIFTTHEDSLLDAGSLGERVLDREQVWVTDKDSEGVTRLTPLSAFRPRADENLRRGYRGGRFGGLPQIREQQITRSGVGN